MDYIGIAFIIITVVVCVHIVYEHAWKKGQCEGRMQILQENLKKSEHAYKKLSFELASDMMDLIK